jgi:hypothetical protein
VNLSIGDTAPSFVTRELRPYWKQFRTMHGTTLAERFR